MHRKVKKCDNCDSCSYLNGFPRVYCELGCEIDGYVYYATPKDFDDCLKRRNEYDRNKQNQKKFDDMGDENIGCCSRCEKLIEQAYKRGYDYGLQPMRVVDSEGKVSVIVPVSNFDRLKPYEAAKRDKFLNNVISFIDSDIETLCKEVAQDLGIDIHYDVSGLYDFVTRKHVRGSFKEIIQKTVDRIVLTMTSMKSEE